MKVNIVDAPCGTGKTTAMINYINDNPDKRFMVITPYLSEITRFIKTCPNLRFKQPVEHGRKLDSLKKLITAGRNICSTHALFRYFDKETIELIDAIGYELILDEVNDVVEQYALDSKDLETMLEKYAEYDTSTGKIIWTDLEYEGNKYKKERNLSETGTLYYFKGCVLVWVFPVDVFSVYKNVFILTYMFDKQIQARYFDLHDVSYNYSYVKDFKLTSEEQVYNVNFSDLINIYDGSLNSIGDNQKALSSGWYTRAGSDLKKIMKNNIYNFFFNIAKSKSSENMWTCFKKNKKDLAGKGYTKGFVPMNARATNEFINKRSLVFPINAFHNPMVVNFFHDKGVTVSHDNHAISTLIQWLFRSRIRRGEKVNLYLPSKRMRTLLEQWIEGNDVV